MIGPTEQNDSPKPRKPKTAPAKPDIRKAPRKDGRVKSTLLLDAQLDVVLTAVAASTNMDRSQLTAQILRAGLQRHNIGKVLFQALGMSPTTGEDRQDAVAA